MNDNALELAKNVIAKRKAAARKLEKALYEIDKVLVKGSAEHLTADETLAHIRAIAGKALSEERSFEVKTAQLNKKVNSLQ